MPGGLFELRRDPITGWWVVVVVDREYDRSRFAMRALPTEDGGVCLNCRQPAGEGVRVRTLRAHAFRLAEGEQVGRESTREWGAAPHRGSTTPGSSSGYAGSGPGFAGTGWAAAQTGAALTADAAAASAGQQAFGQQAFGQPGLGLVADLGSWQAIVAPPAHHGWLADEAPDIVEQMLRLARAAIVDARARGGTDYVQVLQNAGSQAGARTNHLCLDVYDLPQIPHRVGEELGGAARFLIREGICPYCRLVHDEVAFGERLVFEDAVSVAFAPYASRSPFELWVVPRQHQADFGLASDAQVTGATETLRKVIRLLDALDRPPYNLILHTAPLHERVTDTYHWHWEIHPRLREIAGLELGTGLPVNPISPEAAVEELRSRPGPRRAEWPG